MSGERKDTRVGSAAGKLVGSLRRAQWLPSFDRASLRDVVAEMGELYKHLHYNLDMSAAEKTEERACTITFLDTALRRNRQCVLAYLNRRMEKIEELAWNHVGSGQDESPDPIKDRLDQEEIKFSRFYNEVLDRYMNDFNGSVNTGDHEYWYDLRTDSLPPKNPDIEVELLDSFQNRAPGSRFYARRPHVEPLVISGKAKHIDRDNRSGAQKD